MTQEQIDKYTKYFGNESIKNTLAKYEAIVKKYSNYELEER